MKASELNILIDRYFDGELEKEKESFLFTELSLCEESREYFKKMNMIKASIAETFEEFPQELEERILYSIANIEDKSIMSFLSRNVSQIISYSFAAILLIFSIFFYSQTLSYKENLEIKTQQVNQQNLLMESLFNCLPTAEVKGEIEGQVIVKAKI